MALPIPTDDQIASDWDLWREYIDPDATMDRAEFDAMGFAKRRQLIYDTYPITDS